jgi:hypothetical protein
LEWLPGSSRRISIMSRPPLKPLHSESTLIQAKIDQYDRLSTEELIGSLQPGETGSLKVRPDGTVMDGHHRLTILRKRGVDVDALPRELITSD